MWTLSVLSDVFSGAAWSSSVPSLPSRTDRHCVATWRPLGAAFPFFLCDRTRPLLPPQREPTTQQLQGAARHLEGHRRQPSPAVVGLHLPGPRLIHLNLLMQDEDLVRRPATLRSSPGKERGLQQQFGPLWRQVRDEGLETLWFRWYNLSHSVMSSTLWTWHFQLWEEHSGSLGVSKIGHAVYNFPKNQILTFSPVCDWQDESIVPSYLMGLFHISWEQTTAALNIFC